MVNGTGATSGEVQQQIAQLRKEYEAATARRASWHDSFRRRPTEHRRMRHRKPTCAPRSSGPLPPAIAAAGGTAGDARQAAQDAALDRLRERISDQIIQRRVEDLLNPQLEWEGKTPAAPLLSKAADAKPTHLPSAGGAQTDIRPGERLVEGKNVAFKEFPQSALVTYNGDLVQSPDEFSVRVAATIPYVAGDLIRKTRLDEMGLYGSGSSQIPRGKRVFTFSYERHSQSHGPLATWRQSRRYSDLR